MVATIVQVPQNMEGSAWSELLVQLPLFPPSAHPPSTLYPLLAPLLRQKVGLLSLGRGRNWPGTLTWLPPELSYKVNERLKNTKPSTSLEESFRGYRRFDQETILANVASREVNLEFWFTWISHPDEETESGWKLHDIRLPEVDTDLSWFASIDEANQFHAGNETEMIKSVTSREEAEKGDLSDDDSYWDQYDQYTGQVTEIGGNNGDSSIRGISAEADGLTQIKSDDAHYNQYDNVETAIGDSKLMQDCVDGTDDKPSATHLRPAREIPDPFPRNQIATNLGLEDYIRATVRNLTHLAFRSGISRQQLSEIINDAIINA